MFFDIVTLGISIYTNICIQTLVEEMMAAYIKELEYCFIYMYVYLYIYIYIYIYIEREREREREREGETLLCQQRSI